MASATVTMGDTGKPRPLPDVLNSFHQVAARPEPGGLMAADPSCRQYCTRRLRRLYKKTKFLHGRGRFTKKTLEAHMVRDAQ